MSVKIDVSGDIAGVVTLPKQINYATAVALTKTAKAGQSLSVKILKARNIVRGNWWEQGRKYGIKVQTAIPTRLTAVIYTNADWLLEEEGFHGGVKTPDRHAGSLANPDIEHTRHGLRNPVKKNEKARSLLNRASRTKAFKIVSKKGGYTLILQRVGTDSYGNLKQNKSGGYLRGRGKKRTSTLVTKYIMAKSVKVPYNPVITVPGVIAFRSHFNPFLSQELRKAIRTARMK